VTARKTAATALPQPTRASKRPLAANLLPFVQLELAGTVGLEDGRYLGRDPERVLVVRTTNPQTPPRRRLGRAKPKDTDPNVPTSAVPMTTLTVITPEPLGDRAAATAWLEAQRHDEDALDAAIVSALELANQAVHAHRAAVADPGIPDVGSDAALAVRVGFGEGEELVDGHYSEAVDVPSSERRRRRSEALRPTERVAGVLAGRESVAACELLLLRARTDVDAGRDRESALQLRTALAALLAERETFGAEGQAPDIETLKAAQAGVNAAGEAALAGELSPEQVKTVSDALGVAERILRRERASR
jgi:hypothetical protein